MNYTIVQPKLCFLLFFALVKTQREASLLHIPSWNVLVGLWQITQPSWPFFLANPLTWATTFSQLQKASNFWFLTCLQILE
jgi:hypothetical protein